MRFIQAVLAGWLAAGVAGAVEIGDKAPALTGIARWLNGDAVNPAQPDGKTTYIVEFWATWCGPCRQTVPHLLKVAEKFKDRGVVVVGVTQEDEKTVEPFKKEMGMTYRLALDTAKSTDETYGKSVEGIPHAFIVDTNGVVVWAGHPLDGMAEALGDILDGKYDPEKARKLQDQQDRLMEALQGGDAAKAMKILDGLLKENPGQSELHQMKIGLLVQNDDLPGFRAAVRAMRAAFDESSEGLNELAMMFAGPSPIPLKYRDLGLALDAARRAVDLTKEADPACLDTLALIYAALGLAGEAVVTEEKALARATDAEAKAEFRDNLEYFRQLDAWRTAALKPIPAIPAESKPAAPAAESSAPAVPAPAAESSAQP